MVSWVSMNFEYRRPNSFALAALIPIFHPLGCLENLTCIRLNQFQSMLTLMSSWAVANGRSCLKYMSLTASEYCGGAFLALRHADSTRALASTYLDTACTNRVLLAIRFLLGLD